jgi:hypothetical protein
MVKTFNSGQLTVPASLPPVHICFLKPTFFPHSLPLCSKLAPQWNVYIKKIRMQKEYNNLLPGTKSILLLVWKSGIELEVLNISIFLSLSLCLKKRGGGKSLI